MSSMSVRHSAFRHARAATIVLLAVLAAAGSACFGAARARADGKPLAPDEVFQQVAPSIYTVVVADSAENLAAKKDVKQGSAVALTTELAVTNCHVVKDRKLILLVRDTKGHPAELVSSDVRADICLLRPKKLVLTPVSRIRPNAELKVGSRVYAVGSPRGLDRSLSEGLISGLRKRNGIRVIQATAPISLGSSGGGLFDAEGHLIGITTFRSSEENHLNFAVATDEFWPLRAAAAVAGRPVAPTAAPTPKAAARIPTTSGERMVCGPIEIRDIAFTKSKAKCITNPSSSGGASGKHELLGPFGGGFVTVTATPFNGPAGFKEVSSDRLRRMAEQWARGAKEVKDWSEVIAAPYRHLRFTVVYPTNVLSCALGQYAAGDKTAAAGTSVWLGICARGEAALADRDIATIHRLVEVKE